MGRKVTKLSDIGKIPQAIYSPDAQVQRNSDSGLSWTPIGAVGSEVKINKSIPVLFYNSGGTVAYVAFGSNGSVTVTGPTDGMPVLPNQTAVYNSGPFEWVKASSGSVYAYVADYDPTAV